MSKKKKIKPALPVQKTEQIAAQLTAEQFSGPIPHPDILRGYNQVLPGVAERILAMAELDQRHQIEIETSAQKLTANEAKRGQLFGLMVSISAFITSGVALFKGFENAAMFLGGTTVVGLVTVFVTNKPPKNNCKEVINNP
ncbi:MAG: DUF2335 domain-containing protein [Thermodesulfobacteriota bacterium]|nr:DUF2335 domain-containing protein [Thermodesulfobacteriota bacterium]